MLGFKLLLVASIVAANGLMPRRVDTQQSAPLPDEATVRLWVAELAAKHKHNAGRMRLDLARKWAKAVKDFVIEDDITTFVSSANYQAIVRGPMGQFSADLIEAARKYEPLENVHPKQVVTLTLSERTRIAPDLARVIARRGDTVHEPLTTEWGLYKSPVPEGAVFVPHDAVITFALAVFDPVKGEKVKIVLIPKRDTGNWELTVSEATMKRLK